MTKDTLRDIVQTICDKWQAINGDASPFDTYGSGAEASTRAWVQGQIPGIRLKSSEVWAIGKAIKAQSDELKRAGRGGG